jgi:large subunit ribosomal protein L35
MPKMKSHSGAKKRFKVTGRGKVVGRHAFSSHNLGKKTPKRKREMSVAREITGADAKRAKRMLGAGR